MQVAEINTIHQHAYDESWLEQLNYEIDQHNKFIGRYNIPFCETSENITSICVGILFGGLGCNLIYKYNGYLQDSLTEEQFTFIKVKVKLTLALNKALGYNAKFLLLMHKSICELFLTEDMVKILYD